MPTPHPSHGPAELITEAFATFDARTSPPQSGAPASVVLAPWLAYMAPNVELQVGNDPARVGHAAVAQYFDPLMSVLGACVHELLTVSPVVGLPYVWAVRGNLRLTRLRDGQAIQPIGFADTFFFTSDETSIVRYEIRFDPAPIAQLFG